jgi:hypothetical protein
MEDELGAPRKKSFLQSVKNWFELKRQTWLSRGFGYFYPEPTRRVVNLKVLLDLYLQDPMAQRALEQRSKDLFASGFKVKNASKSLERQINEFIHDRDIRLPWKLANCAEDAFRYGNGFLEIEYLNDMNVNHPEKPPQANGIAALHRVSPRQMIIVEDDRINKDGSFSDTYGKIIGYLSIPPLAFATQTFTYLAIPVSRINEVGMRGKLIHPDRILHMKFHTIGDSNVGISLLEPAYNILKEKIKADKVIGTTLVRHAKPILEAIIKTGNPDEIKRAGKILKAINDNPEEVAHVAHDEQFEFKIPSQAQAILNPTPHYNIMIDQLAIMFGVPKRLLMGKSEGTISGSELNLISYFKRLESDQQTVIKPLILKLLNLWHQTTFGKELPRKVDIEFQRVYADEIAAIKSDMLGLQNLTVAFDKGLVPREAARKKACDILGIEYSENEEDYEKSKGDGFPPTIPKGTPYGGLPIIKTPDEEATE